MASLAARPKGPQPVLDSLIGLPDPSLTDDPFQRNGSSNAGLNLHVLPESNGLFQIPTPSPLPPLFDATANPTNPALPHLFQDGRPTLLRAKSDFGPRRLTDADSADSDSKTSDETEWGIRHGFATQLVSEEYNHVLTSVRRQTLQDVANHYRTSSSTSPTRSTRRAGIQRIYPSSRTPSRNGA